MHLKHLSCLPISLSVKGPELINMYVGQSEENVREGERGRGWGGRGPRSPFCQTQPALHLSAASARTLSCLPPLFPSLPSVCQSQGGSPMHHLLR